MKQRTRQTLEIFWNHSKKYKWAIFLLVIGAVGSVLGNVVTPFFYKKLFDSIQFGGPNVFSNATHAIYGVGATLIGVWLFFRLSLFTLSYFQAKVMRDLNNDAFTSIHKHSYNFFNDNFVGSLVRRVNRFERAFEQISDQAFLLIGPVSLRIFIIILILGLRFPVIGLVLAVWVLFYILVNFAFVTYKLKYDLESSQTDSKVSGFLSDTISNQLNIKAFSSFHREFEAFRRLTERHRYLRSLTWNLGNFSEGVQSLLMISLEVLVLLFAIGLWKNGQLTIGDFAFLQAYLTQIFGELWYFGGYIRKIYESFADAEEMTGVFTRPVEIKDTSRAKDLVVTKGKIEFKNVNFEYVPGQPVLTKFNLTIKGGERLAIIGPSGGGKTTITKLIMRFFEVKTGKIFIDSQDISKVKQDSLRENISYVSQEPVLFHRSLLENIMYGRPEATEEEVVRAAKLAHCEEFIQRLPEKYDTYVGERGVKLSGGERQRIAIARAILKNAPILVLDEATSALDSESERLIQDALHNLMAGKTVVVVAHRLSTIMQMDRIVVVSQGKIVEQGKHQELLKMQDGLYQKLWGIQIGSALGTGA